MTAQVTEQLTFDGRSFGVFNEPLYPWLARRKNKNVRFKRRNTSCGRGYLGEWEITDDRLFLVHINGTFSDGRPATLTELFPGCAQRVFADWFTGELRCPSGQPLRYSHAGYSSIYEQELILRVDRGMLIEYHTIQNQPPVLDEFDLPDLI